MAKAAPKAKGNRLKRTTVLILPDEVNKSMRVRFPAEFGDRIGNNATLKIEQFDGGGNVLRTWTPPVNTFLQHEPSAFGGNIKVYYADVSTSDAPLAVKGRKKATGKDRKAAGDLILVTVTVTVPATATEPATTDVFEIEAAPINLP